AYYCLSYDSSLSGWVF
nr:immunoglobulin light chain junction region [Macaca mulatta]MOW31146.1 immunoglobulin light chain junction region [Macaca mulatta]MOW31500.1 immunoglobulin light chain junction region [Macaca mulatta]MOW31802.1 immunoglobulin light chain junction region [Macaca mulatta]MOW31910.1 immunoglobulin light chain junction region [Macaca mulatta]